MAQSEDLNNKYVNIGDELCQALQYVSEDPNRIYEEDGILFASVPGKVKINPAKRTINIENDKIDKIPLVQPGDTVIGAIQFERKYTVGIRITKVQEKFVFDKKLYGNIHVSNVAKRYIEKLDDAYNKPDLVRAKVIGQEGLEYELSTQGPRFGVIKSECIICGTDMRRIGRDMIECPFCGKKEMKKLANDFGDIQEEFEF